MIKFYTFVYRGYNRRSSLRGEEIRVDLHVIGGSFHSRNGHLKPKKSFTGVVQFQQAEFHPGWRMCQK